MGVGSSGDPRGLQVGSTSGPRGIGSVGEPKVVMVWVRVWTQKVWGLRSVLGPKGAGDGLGPLSDQRGLGPCPNPRLLGFGSWPDPRGLGIGACPNPGGLGVRSGGDPRGLGDGSMSGPKLVGVWVLRCPDLRGLGFGSFGVRTQGGVATQFLTHVLINFQKNSKIAKNIENPKNTFFIYLHRF
jgi:hypothetical protein